MGDIVFVQDDEGLFSLAKMEAGFLGKNAEMKVGFLGKDGDRCMKGFPSILPSMSDLLSDASYGQPGCFLDACIYCKKPLDQDMDIFMYRDTPFCSEECRQEQMDIDEAMERTRIISLRVPSSSPPTYKSKFCDFLQRVGSILAG
ncbi:hypothetical protein AAC387_Pa07g2869 [Persea americana]